MKSYLYLSPLLVLLFVVGTEVLHISVFNIKVYERRITKQHTNWHSGVYEWDEVKANLSWEDAYLSFRPNYDNALQHDLDVVTRHKKQIEAIDWKTHSIFTADYRVNVCILDMDISVTDTMLFKKRGAVSMTAYLELMHRDGCEVLYSEVNHDRQFVITDQFELLGIGHWAFIHNKGYELLYTELTDLIPQFIFNFEAPYAQQEKIRASLALTYYLYYDVNYSRGQHLNATLEGSKKE